MFVFDLSDWVLALKAVLVSLSAVVPVLFWLVQGKKHSSNIVLNGINLDSGGWGRVRGGVVVKSVYRSVPLSR